MSAAPKKVLAYCVHGTLSFAILRRVAKALEARGADVQWQFAASHLVSPDETKRTIATNGLKIADYSSFRPDVAIHADPRCSPRAWGCRVIEVPHGLASKIGYYLPGSMIKMDVDVHLAVSEWYAERVRGWHPHVQVRAVGMPKLDGFWETQPTRTHVLFAPTFTKSLNSWVDIAGAADHFAATSPAILRLHRVQLEMLQNERPKSMEFDDSYDITDSFLKARVVVSDVSSAWIEAMGLGIPVVCYLTEGARKHLDLRPMTTEAHFIEHATVITRPDELAGAIESAKPAPIEVQHQIFSRRGQAAQLAAEVILES